MRFLLVAALLCTVSYSPQDSEVYICKGPGSEKYHYNKNCRGLSNCSTSIYKVKLSVARKMGRDLCGWED